MKKTNEFETHGMSYTPFSSGITLYCYNERLTNIEEIIKLEYIAQLRAMRKKHKLFKMLDTEIAESTILGLN